MSCLICVGFFFYDDQVLSLPASKENEHAMRCVR
jgi:hypothetical protein